MYFCEDSISDLAGKIRLAVGSYLDAATTLRTQSNPMLSKLIAATALCQAAASPAELPVTQLQAIDRYVASEMARQQIPGLTLGVYRHGHAVLLKGYGLANIEHDVPATPDTVMQSGSIGKTFTATLVMMLVEQGRLRLDDSIRSHVAGLPETWQAITIGQLLSHTSGIADYDGDELTGRDGPFDVRRDFTEAELVQKVSQLPVEASPGETWSYRNANYLLLGAVIRSITGKFHGDILAEDIFGRLGMTASRVISDQEIVPHRAAGYERREGTLYNQAWVSPTFNSTADGTLYLTVRDLEHWDRALCSASVLAPATLAQMWTPYPVDGVVPEGGYGLGWFVRNHPSGPIVEHDGAWQGFTSYFGRYLGTGVSVAVFTNLHADHSRPDQIGQGVAGLVDARLVD
ncbi:serine hydrolase domain-containing protein [Stenotrophomonas sp.]|uniref:serine hydrolase domain-containing protein n=1 Tax=Stenotrophomonas sp. TaxID=69392 RepID=UPI0028B19E54|nr:serine hydrolase domain-containing protein [Stenotrophomonas sp.]